MKTSIEQLPVELWISIFSYLEAHDILQAFTNLNHYFDQLIASDHLLFNVRIGKSNHNPLEYSVRPYWPDSILDRVVSVQPTTRLQTSHIPEFLRWHCTKLTQLKSLEVKLRGREIPTLCNILYQLKFLQTLSVQCIPNELLIETILSLSTLRVCRLDFIQPASPTKICLNSISNLERLDIKIKEDIENTIINLLLNRMPKLKRLKITSGDNCCDIRQWPFHNATFILPELQSINLNWLSMKSSPEFFDHLHESLPNLKTFTLNIPYHSVISDALHQLIYFWWSIIEKVERINIFMKFPVWQIRNDNDLELKLDKYQATLMAMNEKYDGNVNIKWSENFSIVFKMIEISIHKRL